MSEYIIELNSNAVSGGKFLLGSVYLDATAIVRCRDCEYATKRWTPAHREEVTYCERFVHLAGYNQSAYVEPDGFCAWGERRKS